LGRTNVPLIEIRDLVVEYHGQKVLDGINLNLEEGRIKVVMGPSGSGKSTLLRCLNRLVEPASGSIRFLGEEITGSGVDVQYLRQRIGFVFQQFFLLEGMSAIDNVANGLIYQGVGIKERRERSAETLRRVGLGHRLTHPPSHMSGGERQRVAVARALVHEPAFVLADEPTGNLDSRSTGAVMDLIHGLHDEGTTIAVITHDTTIAASLPRQVSVFDGRIESDSAMQGAFA